MNNSKTGSKKSKRLFYTCHDMAPISWLIQCYMSIFMRVAFTNNILTFHLTESASFLRIAFLIASAFFVLALFDCMYCTITCIYEQTNHNKHIFVHSDVPLLRSCDEYMNAGFKLSGWYDIDPDGPEGALTSFSVYCDLSTGNKHLQFLQ